MPSESAHDILLIVLDDVPRNLLPAYGATSAGRLTPHIDSLSADGATFEAAFTTSPLCTPARWALLTGRFAANASSVVSHRPWNLVGFNTFLTGSEPTLAHALRGAGYRTALVGKYHLGFPLAARPHSGGKAAFGGGGRGLSYDAIRRSAAEHGGFDEVPAIWGGNRQMAQAAHHPEWMAQAAVGFLDRSRAARRKAFLLFAPTLPHAPFALPDALSLPNTSLTPAGAVRADPAWQRGRSALLHRLERLGYVCAASTERCVGSAAPSPACAGSRQRAPLALGDAPWLDAGWLRGGENCEQSRLSHLFGAGVAWIDVGVGEVLSALHRSSLVVLTSDHGASWLGKGSPYEAGIRVPLVVRWRGVIEPGLHVRQETAVATHLDILPTLLSAAAASTRPPLLHGVDLLPTLCAAQQSGRPTDPAAMGPTLSSRPLFVEVGHARAVRLGEWKLIVVNDLHGRCKPPDGAVEGSVCRNFHGQPVRREAAGGGLGLNASGAPARFGLGNMTYDAAARHRGFCERRQLYHLRDDPLEQTNLAASRPEVYERLLSVLVQHVREVEAGNPAVARQPAGSRMGCA